VLLKTLKKNKDKEQGLKEWLKTGMFENGKRATK
jgi:hypothetical protein